MTPLIAAALLIAGTEANFDASTSPSGSGHAHLTTPGGAYFGSVKIGPAVLGVRGAVDQVKLIAEPGSAATPSPWSGSRQRSLSPSSSMPVT